MAERVGNGGDMRDQIVDEGRQIIVGVALLDYSPIAVIDVGDERVVVRVGDRREPVVGVICIGRDLTEQVGRGDQVAVGVVAEAERPAERV